MRAHLAVLLALAALAGCAKPCGPSNCAGCCDAAGVCQAPATEHCGQNGAACTSCVGFQQCLVGACSLPGSSGGSGGPASTASGSTSSTSAASTAASSGSGSTAAGSTGAASGSGASSAGSSGATSSSSAAASTGASTGTSASSAASSSGAGTTGGGTTASSTSGGTTGTVADATLRGTVYSGSPSNPLAGASVSVVGPSQAIVPTDASGAYQVLVAAGSYQLTASAAGYQPSSRSVNVASGQTVSVSFDLAPQGTTAASSSASSASSSGGGTTGGGTTSGTTGGGTTGFGEGSATVSGPHSFPVGAALEFTATDQDGGPDTSDVVFVFYDRPITCADVTAAGGGVPFDQGVRQLVVGEVHNTLGFPLQGGDYGIPSQNFGVDQDSLLVRTFYDDAGYSDVSATSGNIHLDGPVSAFLLTGNFSVVMGDATNLVGNFSAPYCSP